MKHTTQLNEENLKARIRSLWEEIQTEADPYLLNRCRAIFRKEVSFFRRSYMAAYLLLMSEPGGNRGRPGRREAAQGSGGAGKDARRAPQKPQAESRDEASRILPEDETVWLFVSIGRNRKVFSREILGFICSKAQVSRDDIGVIRILDNFSFVQVRTAVADTVIAAMNGQIFRGKTLTVNYARTKKDEESAAESPGREKPQDAAGGGENSAG
jgi:hypothetical protein